MLLLVERLSSSSMVVTVEPLVPTFKFSNITVPVPLALILKSSLDLLVDIELSLIVMSLSMMPPVPDVVNVKSAFVGATRLVIDISPSAPNSNPFAAAFTFNT